MELDLWTVMAILAGVVVVYLLTMRVFFRQSGEAYKRVDFSKVRKLKDDDD